MTVIFKSDVLVGTKILYAVVDQANVQRRHPELFKKVKEITYSMTTRLALSTRDGVCKYYDTVDDAMADSNGFDLVIIQSVGNFIKNNEILIHLQEYYQAKPSFFIIAFTLDWEAEKGEGWVECHNQMIIVNPRTWRQIGSPKFGGWETVTESLPNYARSEENFHDKYTPFWIQRAPGSTVKTRTKQGWGYIKAALENGLRIENFTQAMRDCRLYVYPETDCENLWQAFNTRNFELVKNPNQKKWIKSLTPTPTIWIYNSEHYKFNINLSRCDTYIGPAAGFKYLDMLTHREDASFIFYDFHQKSLDWIRQLKETWDGEDFPAYLKRQNDDFKSCYKYINKDIPTNQKKLFDDFGGEDKFKELWRKFKSCKAEFVLCDLYDRNQVDALLDKAQGTNPFVYYSNIFATDFTLTFYTLEYVQLYHKGLVEDVFGKYPKAITHGTDGVGHWMTKKSL